MDPLTTGSASALSPVPASEPTPTPVPTTETTPAAVVLSPSTTPVPTASKSSDRTPSPLSAAATSFIGTSDTTDLPSSPLASSATPAPPLSSDAPVAAVSDPENVIAPAPQSSSNGLVLPPAPHRRPRRRHAPPLKGILKPPTASSKTFSFRRDILQSFNSRLAYATSLSANTTAAAAAAAAALSLASSQDRQGHPDGSTPASVVPAAVALGNGVETFKNVVTAAAGTGHGAAAAAGGFFGSAFKRFSTGVSNVATGGHAAPLQRDLTDDPPTPPHREERYAPVLGADIASSVLHLPTESATQDPVSQTEHKLSHGGPAPHTPARANATSGKAATSPYATIHASAHAPSSTSLSTPPAPPPLSVEELKRVRFRMATLKVVYPINGPNGPIAPYEESRTRKRINFAHRESQQLKASEGGDAKGWTGEALGKLYAECCRTREERPNERLRRIFVDHPVAPPRVLDLTNEPLTHGAVEALSDLLSVDFGLKKLVLENCGIDNDSIRPLVHALLVSGSIPTISLANNRRIRNKGWKYLAIFMRKASFLRYIDLSENVVDRKTTEFILQSLVPHTIASLPPAPVNGLNSAPAVNGHEPNPEGGVRGEDKDLPDQPPRETETEPEAEKGEQEEAVDEEGELDEELQPTFSVAPLLKEDPTNRAGSVVSMRLENCGLKGATLEALAHGIRSSTLKHLSIRRNRIQPLGGVALAIMIRDYPIAADHHSEQDLNSPSMLSSPTIKNSLSLFEGGNSVTARLALREPFTKRTPPSNGVATAPAPSTTEPEGFGRLTTNGHGPSEATLKLRRQIEELPRMGSLLTLDVKNNDLRHGVTYVAQVLKRNRTLKVLNLSENKIDMQGLVAIAEALKYNNTLETLDLSYNPCCGPSLEGITSLRTAITINSNLKRVFLNHTDLTSEGAIALSEFLPEARSLIHLDLTGNNSIDIAGVMALSVSVKMNTTLRCLDLNIPPNDPDFARLSQDILQCCIRNTEQAQEEAASGGKTITIAAPILKSAVARDLKERQEAQQRQERRREMQARSKDEIVQAAEGVRDVLADMLAVDEELARTGVIVQPAEVVRDSLVQAQLAEAQLAEAIAATRPGDQKDRAVLLGDALSALLDRAKALYEPKVAPSTLQVTPTGTVEAESTNFVLDDSDSEDDYSAPATSNPETGDATSKATDVAAPNEDAVNDDDNEMSIKTPLEFQSRSLTLEEGEIFRKGSALGTGQVDDDDDELDHVSGEELKKEVMEATVERSSRGSFEERPSV
ncbi:hypothetical protein MVLG_05872 [Microbotryum lychnidis-dioicae p1A1 Lamole]|uniref:GAT domain-containing protein n=1 Tax=Microbotryum lychnidis-dioicae (strain p1A1 Lamole / MvSl-1064) TaxID=683840 RepID=U5HFJ6_USTV1|nr:hypothetical protein MVLG_05872 [Microbotryum lychnidis-dioicae p1A1 Lamole]|eukprot:KDE03683.1 hypothetical protein MVLG_05872 [Microbotryum lychnidis-dioicae p1A1 Lamole]